MDLASAVVRTLAYSAFFNFPLDPKEVHYWLISPHLVSFRKIGSFLHPLTSRELNLRQSRQRYSREKARLARQFADSIRWLPGIELIALTGSVAVDNAQQHDDIDLLIITKPFCLWLLRPLFIFLLNRRYLRRHPGDDPQTIGDNAFCPNLWLETVSLSLPRSKRNLYTAHEILQIKPLYDPHHTYSRFLRSNRWVSRYLANAYHYLLTDHSSVTTPDSFTFLLAPLAYFLYFFQRLYMLPKHTTESVALHSAFFHKKSLITDLTRYLDQKTTPTSIRPQKTL